MAKKVSNIPLPDGSNITVPTWASESTMEQVVNYMAAANKVDQKFLTLMKGVGADVNVLQKSIANVVQPIKQNAKNDVEAKKDDIDLARGVKGTARALMKASSFFGKTDAPLSGMVGAAEQLTDNFKSAMPGFLGRYVKEGGRMSSALSYFGSAADVAADAVLAFAGWNAAKLEQFADAQKKMIDAGAIYYSSGDQFDLLYSNSLDAGVTYNAMIDTVSQFGSTMTGIGGSVSAGTVDFVEMFDNLNETADAFGDLGLSSKEMMGQYAEFLEYSRLTGTLNRGLANNGEKLNQAFINLQIESTGLANLTALSKSEAMRRQMDALTQPLVVLGASSLEERGFPGSAEVVRGITARLGLIAPDNEIFQQLLDGFAQEVAETTDPANFDIAKRLDPNLRGAIMQITPNLIDNLNNMVRAGTVSAEEAGDTLFKTLMDADMNTIMSAGAQTGSTLKLMTEFQAALYKYNLDFAAYNSMSTEEREKYRKDLEGKMETSGRSVQMMNDVTETFLQVQDAMTLPLQSTYEVFDDLTNVLENSASRVKQFFGIDAGDGFGDYMDENYQREAFGHLPPGQMSTYTPPSSTTSQSNSSTQTATNTPGVSRIPDPELRKRAEAARNDLNDPSIRGRMTESEILNNQMIIKQDIEFNAEVGSMSPVLDDDRNIIPITAAQVWDTIKDMRNAQPRGSDERTRLSNLMNQINKSTTTDDEAAEILRQARNRRMGGPVEPNKPYIVGDQLGMGNAELFVPETAGNIVNNRDLNTMISNLVSGQDLTSGDNGAIIEELKQEYLSLIESKTQTVQVMASLREAIRLFNDNKNRKAKIDIINSV